MSDSADGLKKAIELQHGGTATLAQSVPVKETHAGAVVWEGVVHVFDLAGHPTASRAYACHPQSREAISPLLYGAAPGAS